MNLFEISNFINMLKNGVICYQTEVMQKRCSKWSHPKMESFEYASFYEEQAFENGAIQFQFQKEL